ncbi:MAG: hypothetical protein H7228_09480 [Polaromonas sp.]|nr:hypothetical protein [Polaromonas sp.]
MSPSVRGGTSRQRVGVTGDMRPDDDLYVKWRLKDTGKVYEDTVDLRSRLPRSIKNQSIYFIIDGEQLYVYLISFETVREDAYPEETLEKMYAEMDTPHKRAFRGQLRNSVVMVYPQSKKLYPINSK